MPDASLIPDDLLAIDTPRAILERLVAFPTVSRDSNLPLIEWVAAWLAARSIASTRVPNADGTKASLYAQTGPEADGGVLLSGHTDVVPVEGQDWATDPFTVTERDGKLFGRGTADMKGFVALALWAMQEAARRGVTRPLQIALSRDEEIGCIGAPEMLAHMAAQGFPRAGAAIIGEPTMMACVTGHKGSTGYQIIATGYEVHSSLMHEGVSAIMEAARFIDWANACNAENAAKVPDSVDAAFVPPWTTLHVGQIAGGTAHNITAGSCTFGFGFRAVPSERVDAWEARMRAKLDEIGARMAARHPKAGFAVEELFVVPALAPEAEGAAEALVRRLTGDNASHVVSYGTEAGQFQDAGYSAVVCGPGDIAQAHQANEFISLTQIEAGAAFLRRLLEELGAK